MQLTCFTLFESKGKKMKTVERVVEKASSYVGCVCTITLILQTLHSNTHRELITGS